MMSNRVICFGEIMGRLNPEGYQRFVQATRFEMSYAGGEANVAVSLANFGMDAAYVTALPKNDLGSAAKMELQRYGVDTSLIHKNDGRLGLYFVEKGASQRASRVIYDRENSAIALAKVGDFDWERIFQGAKWFHFTGITPALGKQSAQLCEDACRTAHQMGVKVSCDLNYRKALWSREQAQETMSKLMEYVDICIANEEDASDVFQVRPKHSDVRNGKLCREDYTEMAEELTRRFGFSQVAFTLRTSISASVNHWAGMLYHDGQAYFSKEYIMAIVDRVGGGDSFNAALIYSLLQGMPAQQAVEFAVAASCLKHSIEHDFNLVSVEEVQRLVGGDGSGRVQR